MKVFNSPKLRFLYKTWLLFLITMTLYRLFFLFGFKNELTDQGAQLILKSFFLGFRFDMRLCAIFLALNIIFLNLPINIKFKEKTLFYLNSLLITLFNFLYVLDAGYFSYLKARVNATVIAFLKNPIISLQMVQQSYPVFFISLLIIFSSAFLIFLFKKYILPDIYQLKEKAGLKTKSSRLVLFLVLFTFSLYGSFKSYPLRWSEAFLSTDSFTSNLSLNPILYIVDTYSFRTIEDGKNDAHKYYESISEYLGVDFKNSHNLNFVRSFEGNPERQKTHPNVVIIIMESMAYFKTGLGGSKVNPTPSLDSLAKESLLFDHFFTPTVATARSVFAAITSLPDVTKVQSGTRNPFIVDQNTIMGQVQNYEKYYFIGGSANWGNIRGVLTYNIPGLHLFEEGSYSSPRVDVWGISDLDLFKEAFQNLNSREKSDSPFFTVIQTSGFHRPYTIPTNAEGFKSLSEKEVNLDEIKSYGFESLAEYNAMRLQDFSLGEFLKLAKKSPWYDNTIFLVFGDHALPHSNAKNVPEWMKSMANNFHVPFLIHSSKYIKPGIEKKIASEVDVMPTIAGLIGIPYKTRALGRDLFNPKFDKYRAAFSYNWYAPFQVTLIDDQFYYEFIPYNGNTILIKYDESDNTVNVKDKYPEKLKSMKELSQGLLESTRHLLFNNSKKF